MSDLATLLSSFSHAALTEREKGTYFEDLVLAYLRTEPTHQDFYSEVWTYADWAKTQGLDAKDAGIDLVARTAGTGDYHAIQCKFYAPDYKLHKADIDSFFTASGKKPFTHRLIFATTDLWSEHAEAALQDQHIPVTKIDLILRAGGQEEAVGRHFGHVPRRIEIVLDHLGIQLEVAV